MLSDSESEAVDQLAVGKQTDILSADSKK
jgi:hypothetical protein